MMKTTRLLPLAGVLITSATLNALTVEVQKFADGQDLPAGYQDVTDGIEASESINVTADPFVDYLIPTNSGAAGVAAQKDGGMFIVSSTVAEMGGNAAGANNSTDPDKWHVVFEWEDGTPLPFGAEFYGVSWANWSADSTATLITRVDLASSDEVTVYHWFNDGWNYQNGHNVLPDGHKLTVEHFTANGSSVASQSMDLTSGGAESFFGDHRQFFSSIIKATATADGDYLIITNEGGNIGYKGTAVAIMESQVSDWYGYPLLEENWVNTESWMGFVNVTFDPWVWVLDLSKYVYVGDDSGWAYVPR